MKVDNEIIQKLIEGRVDLVTGPVVSITPDAQRAWIYSLQKSFMAFHQNGLTLTYFARDYVATSATGVQSMFFDVINIVLVIVSIYAAFAVVQSKSTKGKGIATLIVFAALGALYYKYTQVSGAVAVDALQ